MKYLCNGDLSLSCLGLGTRAMGKDDNDWAAVVDLALAEGINLIDTAPLYQNGRSEELLGRLLQGRRQQVILSGKVGTHGRANALTPQALTDTLHQSLKRLRTDYIDILHIHYPDPRADYSEIAHVLGQFQKEGLIRFYGLSNFDRRELARWPMDWPPVTMQLPYSLLQWEQYRELTPHLNKHSIIPLVYTPLAAGLLAQPIDAVQTTSTAGMLYAGLSPEGQQKLAAFHALAREHNLPPATLALTWSLNQGKNIALLGTGSPAHLKQALAAVALCREPIVQELIPIPQPLLPFAAKVTTVLESTGAETLAEIELTDMPVQLAVWVPGTAQAGDEVQVDGLSGQVIA